MENDKKESEAGLMDATCAGAKPDIDSTKTSIQKKSLPEQTNNENTETELNRSSQSSPNLQVHQERYPSFPFAHRKYMTRSPFRQRRKGAFHLFKIFKPSTHVLNEDLQSITVESNVASKPQRIETPDSKSSLTNENDETGDSVKEIKPHLENNALILLKTIVSSPNLSHYLSYEKSEKSACPPTESVPLQDTSSPSSEVPDTPGNSVRNKNTHTETSPKLDSKAETIVGTSLEDDSTEEVPPTGWQRKLSQLFVPLGLEGEEGDPNKLLPDVAPTTVCTAPHPDGLEEGSPKPEDQRRRLSQARNSAAGRHPLQILRHLENIKINRMETSANVSNDDHYSSSEYTDEETSRGAGRRSENEPLMKTAVAPPKDDLGDTEPDPSMDDTICSNRSAYFRHYYNLQPDQLETHSKLSRHQNSMASLIREKKTKNDKEKKKSPIDYSQVALSAVLLVVICVMVSVIYYFYYQHVMSVFIFDRIKIVEATRSMEVLSTEANTPRTPLVVIRLGTEFPIKTQHIDCTEYLRYMVDHNSKKQLSDVHLRRRRSLNNSSDTGTSHRGRHAFEISTTDQVKNDTDRTGFSRRMLLSLLNVNGVNNIPANNKTADIGVNDKYSEYRDKSNLNYSSDPNSHPNHMHDQKKLNVGELNATVLMNNANVTRKTLINTISDVVNETIKDPLSFHGVANYEKISSKNTTLTRETRTFSENALNRPVSNKVTDNNNTESEDNKETGFVGQRPAEDVGFADSEHENGPRKNIVKDSVASLSAFRDEIITHGNSRLLGEQPTREDGASADKSFRLSGELASRQSDELAPRQSDEHAPRQSDEHAPRQSDEHAPRQSDEHAPRQSDEHASRQSDEHAPRQSDEHAPRQSDEHAPRQSDEHAPRQSDEHAPRQSDEHAPRQSDEHAPRQSDEHAPRQSDEHAPRQSDEHAPRQSDEHAPRQSDEHAPRQSDEHASRHSDEHAPHHDGVSIHRSHSPQKVDRVPLPVVPDMRNENWAPLPVVPDKRSENRVPLPVVPDRRSENRVPLQVVPDKRNENRVPLPVVPDRKSENRVPPPVILDESSVDADPVFPVSLEDFLPYETVDGVIKFNDMFSEMQCIDFKGRARLELTRRPPLGDVNCFSVHWESSSKGLRMRDCIVMDNNATGAWWGIGDVTGGTVPLTRMGKMDGIRLYSGEIQRHTIGGHVRRAWISSAGILVTVPFISRTIFSVNSANKTSGEFCLSSEDNFNVNPFFERENPILDYTVCSGPNVTTLLQSLRLVEAMNEIEFTTSKWRRSVSAVEDENVADRPAGVTEKIVEEVIERFNCPLWRPWLSHNDASIDQDKVIAYAESVVANAQITCGHILLPVTWQRKLGDLDFDPERFPNPKLLIEVLARKGLKLALTLSSVIETETPKFKNSSMIELLIMQINSTLPILVSTNQATAAGVLDFTNSNTVRWYSSELKKLRDKYNIDSFHLSPLSTESLPPFRQPKHIHHNPDFALSEFIRTVSHIRAPISTDSSVIPVNVPTFLTAGHGDGSWDMLEMLPNRVMSISAIGGTLVDSGVVGGWPIQRSHIPARELYIRWMETSMFLPAMQISALPSMYDVSVQIYRDNLLALRKEHVLPRLTQNLSEALINGYPLITPLVMAFPKDHKSLLIGDQWLIGKDMMVAPVLRKGRRTKDIYLPPGIWKDGVDHRLFKGKRWLKNYNAPLGKVPFFFFITPEKGSKGNGDKRKPKIRRPRNV